MGGSIAAALRIADTVHGDEFECTVVGTHSTLEGVDALRREYPRLAIVSMPHHFPRHSFASSQLRRWLQAHTHEFDLVHSHGIFNFPYLYAFEAAKRAGRPFVLSPHNSLDPYDLRKKRLLKRHWFGPLHVRPMLKYAASLLCTADREAREAVTYGTHPPRHVLPLPVPAPPTAATRSDGRSLRERLGLRDDALIMLFLSRLDRKKGLDLVIRALAQVPPQERIHLAIAGDTESRYRRELRALSDSLGVASRIHWMGFLAGDVKALTYEQADFFVLPSYNENFGLVLVEALYHGLPLVVSDQVYIADALEGAGVAHICQPTVASTLEAILRAAGAPEWRAGARRAAPLAAAKLYSPATLAPAYLRYYSDLLTAG